MRHIIFLIAYIYFLLMDLKRKEINISALAIYAVVAIFTVAMTRNEVGFAKLVDMMFSIAFGLVIYFLSYFSREGIGLADGLYFVINGLLLSLKENIILFLTGLIVAFMIGIILYIFQRNKYKSSRNVRLPFMPCFLPAIIGYILCIV